MMDDRDVAPEDIFELTPFQKGMLFHSLYAPETDVYHIQLETDLSGALDCRRFQEAWRQVVQRHGVLRTGFLWKGLEQPYQVVYPTDALDWREEDWRSLSESERVDRLVELRQEERSRPFDLEQPPLMRLLTLRFGDEHYRFLWTFHHMILEGWSASIVLREVGSLYSASLSGEQTTLEPVRPYRDYIQWLQERDRSAAQDYWRDVLADYTGPTVLPMDRGASEVLARVVRNADCRAQLDSELTRSLKEFARRSRVTMSTVLQGAWSLLLSRYSGQEQVVYGVVTSGRPASLPGSASMVGLFVNVVPAPVSVPGEATLEDWLVTLQRDQAASREHEYLSVQEIQECCDLPRGKPLFNNALVFENWQSGANIKLTKRRSQSRTTYASEGVDLPLALTVAAEEETNLILRYDPSRFDEASVERMLGHLTRLLSAFPEMAQARLDQVPLTTDDERRLILEAWQGASRVVEGPGDLGGLLSAQASRTPESIAVEQGASSLTYGELERRSSRLASSLSTLGVGRDVPVAIFMERSLDMVAGVCGVLQAGGAYLPLDPSYPAERLSYMLEDSGAPVIVTAPHLVDRLPSHGGEVVCVEPSLWEAPEVSGWERPRVEGNDLAYIIYTSGSTGRPKGVMGTHRGMVNRLQWMWDAYPFGADERCCHKTTLSFVDAVAELFLPLLKGVPLVMADGEAARDPLALARLVGSRGITRLVAVPSLLRALLDLDEGSGLEGLRYCVSSGERLDGDLEARFRARYPGCVLINLYGSSEVSADATYFDTSQRDGRRGSLIGRPISNTRAYALDGRLGPVPIGVPGELYIGGPGVARGYLGRPELTAERFLEDPFDPAPGARLYKTGDLVRYREDGVLEYLGRLDDQVKIRGNRVEPGEVEAVLGEHAAVGSSAVACQADAAGDAQLVGYVVRTDEALDGEALRGWLSERLPGYMVPTAWSFLEALPLTPSGKVDRKALPAVSPDRQPHVDYVAPRDETEERLAEIWREILGIDRVGVHDDFFQLGGHSLMAVRVLNRVNASLGLEVSLSEMIAHPSVAGMAECVRSSAPALAEVVAIPVGAVSRGEGGPLSFAQERLWFLDQLEPGNPSYNLPLAVRLSGELEVAALEESIREIARRHEALRTRFEVQEGKPVQLVDPGLEISVDREDLTGLSPEDQDEEVRELYRDEALRAFELDRGPLLRATLVRLSETEHVLLVCLHHVAADGWSFGILFKELNALYGAYSKGEASPLAELPLQYADFAAWQRDWLEGARLEQSLAYWRRQLADLETLELPTDRPRPKVQTYRGARESIALPAELRDKAEALARQAGATPFMFLLSVFGTLFQRYSGQDDIAVGTAVAQRDREELEGLIGFFVNTLVFRMDLSGDPTVLEFVKRVREVALEAYAHQAVPFEKLVDELQPTRDWSRNPLFQVLIAMQNVPFENVAFEGLSLRAVPFETETTRFDLEISLADDPSGIFVSCAYNTDLFDPTTVRGLLDSYRRLLEEFVANPDKRISHLGLLNETERHRLLAEWNDTAADFPDECVPRLVEHQARRTPDAVAVMADDGELSYAELDRRANRLARYLGDLGVGPETLVGICFDRRVDLPVVLLAVLKAGAGYVALDPAFPSKRLSFMCEDSKLSLVLTHNDLPLDLSAIAAPIVNLDDVRDEVLDKPAGPLDDGPGLDDIAYVMYTSGSTGNPKGVRIEHRALTNFLWSMRHRPGLSESDTLLSVTTLSFDIAGLELYLPLIAGARLAIASRETTLDAQALSEALDVNAVSVMQATPATWQMLVASGWEGKSDLKALCGGEALPPALAEALLTRCETLWNLYGPTETTIWSTLEQVGPESVKGTVSVGRPIANTRTYVLDRWGAPVPVGVLGELHIGGAGLARDYLDRPELTVERFLPDPFSGGDGARMYRTGDLVRYRPDGRIDCIGRLDHQVKLRGHRIELGELEAVVSAFPGVEQAIALCREDRPGDKRLVAYAVAGENDLDTEALRDWSRERLPPYMVPSAFSVLDELPLTPNGKVDRRALPAPDSERRMDESTFESPATETERLLARIWEEKLDVDRVGANENFFDLGGHSLLTIEAISDMAEQTGVRISPAGYMMQNLRQIAAIYDRETAKAGER